MPGRMISLRFGESHGTYGLFGWLREGILSRGEAFAGSVGGNSGWDMDRMGGNEVGEAVLGDVWVLETRSDPMCRLDEGMEKSVKAGEVPWIWWALWPVVAAGLDAGVKSTQFCTITKDDWLLDDAALIVWMLL